MAIRRRRRRKYTWFPILGTSQGTDVPARTTIESLAVDIDPTGLSLVGVKPVTYDVPQDNNLNFATQTTPLNDFIGDEYFIKRIVGKLFLQYLTTGTLPPNPVCVTAGLFIARCDDSNLNAPVAFATESDLYNPALTDTIREPWIWRRTWILGTQNNVGTAGAWPQSNAVEPSGLDGPHIDAKTARRVRQQERLFIAVAAQNYPVLTPTPVGVTEEVLAGFDLRILGSLRKSRNRDSF